MGARRIGTVRLGTRNANVYRAFAPFIATHIQRCMKKWGEVALGLVTGIGGFLEIGSIATTAQAGAEFGLQLAWVLLVGTVGLAFLMEMSGRLSAVSRGTYVDQLRERFGVRFFMAPLAALLVVSLLVIASEIGGICLALEMATGIGLRWWALAVTFVGWLLLWRGKAYPQRLLTSACYWKNRSANIPATARIPSMPA